MEWLKVKVLSSNPSTTKIILVSRGVEFKESQANSS
jgi:hypothetical protein